MYKLIADGELMESGPYVCRAGHEIHFSAGQEKDVNQLLSHLPKVSR